MQKREVGVIRRLSLIAILAVALLSFAGQTCLADIGGGNPPPPPPPCDSCIAESSTQPDGDGTSEELESVWTAVELVLLGIGVSI